MKKISILVVLMFWLVGSVGGFFSLIYHNEHPIALALVAVIGLSWPSVVKYWKELAS